MKNLIKKAFIKYCNNMYNLYKPCYDAGINPFI